MQNKLILHLKKSLANLYEFAKWRSNLSTPYPFPIGPNDTKQWGG